MLEVTHSNGFFVRSDGTFWAHAGLDSFILKAEQRGDTLAYPFKARYSTPDKDREKETVIQKGLNFSPFKEHGVFNWNHIGHAEVGVPTGEKAWFDEAGWQGQGEIIKGMPIWPGYDTDMVVQQHNQFKKGGFQRGLCCSIEGKVTKRSNDGRYIEKADVYNVALTFRPINPNCTVSLSKALAHQLPIIEGDAFYRSLSASGAAPFFPEDLEGASGSARYIGEKVSPKVAKRLVKHLVAKGYAQGDAIRHVAKFMSRQSHQRRA
jgi:hypothetical protein